MSHPQQQQQHSYSDLFSALQKFIRRGHHQDVAAVASEIVERALQTNDYGKFDGFWRRLFIIATEDIGVAQKGTIRYLQEMHKMALRAQPFGHVTESSSLDVEAKRISVNAAYTLSCSPKSRLTDHAYIFYSRFRPIISCTYDRLLSLLEFEDEAALLEFIASVCIEGEGTDRRPLSRTRTFIWQLAASWMTTNLFRTSS